MRLYAMREVKINVLVIFTHEGILCCSNNSLLPTSSSGGGCVDDIKICTFHSCFTVLCFLQRNFNNLKKFDRSKFYKKKCKSLKKFAKWRTFNLFSSLIVGIHKQTYHFFALILYKYNFVASGMCVCMLKAFP